MNFEEIDPSKNGFLGEFKINYDPKVASIPTCFWAEFSSTRTQERQLRSTVAVWWLHGDAQGSYSSSYHELDGSRKGDDLARFGLLGGPLSTAKTKGSQSYDGMAGSTLETRADRATGRPIQGSPTPFDVSAWSKRNGRSSGCSVVPSSVGGDGRNCLVQWCTVASKVSIGGEREKPGGRKKN